MNDSEKTKETVDYAGVEAGDFGAFRRLVSVLRGEHGCPWDRAQTFESLKPCMLDEINEVLEGIDIYQDTGNPENLCEELGDVLLHIVLSADMAEEKGLFTMEDIVRGIGRKMLRRHPHVFGEESRRGWDREVLKELDELPRSWDEIKQLEKRKQSAFKAKDKENLDKTTVPLYKY